jgi:hypothetical protein
LMGAVFAHASATNEVMAAGPKAVAAGMRITFSVAALLIVIAFVIAAGARALRPMRSSFVI